MVDDCVGVENDIFYLDSQVQHPRAYGRKVQTDYGNGHLLETSLIDNVLFNTV